MAGPDNQPIESGIPKPPDKIPESRGIILPLVQARETLINISEEVDGDILKRRLQHDISRLDRVRERLSSGEPDTMGEVIPSIPYLNNSGVKRLKSFPLDSTRYDPEFKVSDLLLDKLGVKLPEGKTISQFLSDVDSQYARNYQLHPTPLYANQTADWTFPTNVSGLGIDVNHFLVGGGTSLRLVFEQAEEKDNIAEKVRDIELAVESINTAPELLPDYPERVRALSQVFSKNEPLLVQGLESEKTVIRTIELIKRVALVGLDSDKKELSEFTNRFLSKHSGNVVNILANNEYNDSFRDQVFEWLSQLAQNDPQVANALTDEVIKNFSTIVQAYDDKSIGVSLYDFVDYYASSKEQKLSGWEEFKKTMGDFDPSIQDYVSTQLQKALPSQHEDFNSFLQDTKRQRLVHMLLGAHGLRYNWLKKIWKINDREQPESRNTEILRNNLLRIRELEEARPGICRVLHREFGISHFGRYPSDLLIKQYDQRKNIDTPYGLVLYPMADWNGAFHTRAAMLTDFASQLEGHFALRIVEAESKFDAARHLIHLDKQYGQNQKISFAIVGGHSNTFTIRLGGGRNRERVNLFELKLKGIGFQRLRKFFIPNPPIILDGCQLGVEGGMAKNISLLGADVLASKEETRLEKVTLIGIAFKKPFFDAQYHEGPGIRYTSGKISSAA